MSAEDNKEGMESQTFDIVEVRSELNSQLANSQEVDDIVSSINVYEANSLVTFGADVANEISRCSDMLLNSVDMSQLNESSKLLDSLAKIMNKFDIDEITETKKGIFGKLFDNMKNNIQKILDKYHTMGEEVDKIYVQLKQYESEINQSNQKLQDMFGSNVEYYKQLVKYILAGEQGVKEINAFIEQKNDEYSQTGDNAVKFDIMTLEQAKELLEQRTQDLRIAENVAMQSIPMIKTMQISNLNLIRKINSAFIITLPVFKQALTQAVLLKRQRIQAEALSALDEKTNEMLLKNAQNLADQSKRTAELASGSSVKVETLEKTWKTIMNGISETKQIQENASKQRQEEIIRLNKLKADFEKLANV